MLRQTLFSWSRPRTRCCNKFGSWSNTYQNGVAANFCALAPHFRLQFAFAENKRSANLHDARCSSIGVSSLRRTSEKECDETGKTVAKNTLFFSITQRRGEPCTQIDCHTTNGYKTRNKVPSRQFEQVPDRDPTAKWQPGSAVAILLLLLCPQEPKFTETALPRKRCHDTFFSSENTQGNGVPTNFCSWRYALEIVVRTTLFSWKCGFGNGVGTTSWSHTEGNGVPPQETLL